MRSFAVGAVAVLLLAAGPGCRKGEPATAPAPAAAPVPDAAFLRAAVARAQLRFVERQGAHRARGDFYEIEARGDGAVSVGVLSEEGEAQGALAVRTVALRREGWAQRGVDRVAAADAALSIHRGPVVERWENGARHTRQSWAFGAEPPGKGPLEVRVSVTGMPLASAAPHALHFARKGQPGFRYGDVAWVDGAGVRTPLALRFAGGTASIEVPGELLARSRYPAVLDPTLSPEREVDQPLLGPAWRAQRNAAIASDPSRVLVVWDDARHDVNGDIYGELISRDANVLPLSANLPIAVGLRTSQDPAVAYNGTRYLVVWTEEDLTGNWDIRGAFVERNGAVGVPFAVTTDPAEQGIAAVAADPVSRRFLVAYWDLREGAGRIYCSVVNGDLPQKEGGDLQISGVTGEAGSPAVAFDGTHFVVAWEDTRFGPSQILANRVEIAPAFRAVDGTGVRLDATGSSQSAVAVAAGAGQALAVWEDTRDAGPGTDRMNLFGRLFRDGGVQFPGPYPVRSSEGDQRGPALAFDGLRYWLAYSYVDAGVSEIRSLRLSTDGGVEGLENVARTNGGLYYRPALAGVTSTLGDMGLVFDDSPPNSNDERGDVYYTQLTPGSIRVLQISRGANAQVFPEAASDGTQYLVVWSDGRNPASDLDVYGIWVDLQGAPKDPAAWLIGGGPNRQSAPHVAYGGGVFLVTWSDEERQVNRYDLVGRRVDPAGPLLDPSKRYLFDAGWSFELDETIAHGGGAFLVAFETGFGELRGIQVAPSGTVLGPPSGLLAFPDGGSEPSLAFDGTHYVLAFQRGGFTSSRIYAARIRPDGGVVDSDGIEVSQGPGSRFKPSVIFDGRRSLVSWSEIRPTGDFDVLGAYLSASGVPTASIPLVATPAQQTGVSGTFDGEKVLLVWQETDSLAGVSRLWAGWIADGGTVVSDSQQVSGDVQMTFFQKPSTPAGSGAGQALVPYYRATVAPGYNAERVLVRAVDSRAPLGSSCTGGAQCRSGFCADGVCCNSACGASDPSDCQVCNASGTCTLAPGTQLCRASQGVCDPAESCDGMNGACPADVRAGPSTVCNPALGPCDVAETCDGVAATCPADQIAPATFECRPAQGGCDVAETCDGLQLTCPADQIATAGTVCRPAAGTCDVEEICTGASRLCPDEAFQADGTACEDNGTCQVGVCSSARTSYYGWHCQGCAGGGSMAPWAAAVALVLVALRRSRRAVARVPVRGRGLRGLWGPVALGALALGAPGRAEEPTRLLFVGITPKAGVTQAQADTAGSFVQSELTSFGAYRVAGSAEIAAVLGVERQKMLLGCSEEGASCLAELAGGLDADRVLAGDLGILGSELLLNLTLVDAKTARPIHRTVVRAPVTGSIDQVLDGVKPALYELIVKDAGRRGPEVKLDRGFGGLVASLRGEADVAGRSITPSVSMELSAKHLGGALTVVVQPVIGVRAEGRYYPIVLGGLRPYLGLGATSFVPAVAGRVVAGAVLRLGQLQLHADAAYEYFFNPAPGYFPSAVLVATGAGWQF